MKGVMARLSFRDVGSVVIEMEEGKYAFESGPLEQTRSK